MVLVWFFPATPQWDVKGWRNARKFAGEVRSFIRLQEERKEAEEDRAAFCRRVREKMQQKQREREEQREQQREQQELQP